MSCGHLGRHRFLESLTFPSVSYPGVGDKSTTEFTGDSNGHFQGPLECAEESLEMSTARTLAERVSPCDQHFVQTNGNEFLQWDGVAEDDDVDDDSPRVPRALSAESEAGAVGIVDGTWQDGSEGFGMTKADPTASRFRQQKASLPW